MSITLSCPGCGRRFRARDESAGKRVGCPFCRAAVAVPHPRPSPAAQAPTEVITAPAPVGRPFPLADPDAPPATDPLPVPLVLRGGDGPPPADPAPAEPSDEWLAPPDPPPSPTPPAVSPAAVSPAAVSPAAVSPAAVPPASAAAAVRWGRVDRGLFWVQFGLVWLAAPACVPLAQTAGELVGGAADESPAGPDVVALFLYGVPAVVGLLAFLLGRAIATAAPAESGARGLFAASAVLTLAGLAGALATAALAAGGRAAEARHAAAGVGVGLGLAEVWFLFGLGLIGPAVGRPAAAGAAAAAAVGLGLVGAAVVVGWPAYAELARPPDPPATRRLAEAGAVAAGWLVAVGLYWRAVRATRRGVDGWFARPGTG